jgi:hypothetical protein
MDHRKRSTDLKDDDKELETIIAFMAFALLVLFFTL